MHRHDRIAALAVLVFALYSACVISQPAVTTDDATPDMINATVEAVNGDASLIFWSPTPRHAWTWQWNICGASGRTKTVNTRMPHSSRLRPNIDSKKSWP